MARPARLSSLVRPVIVVLTLALGAGWTARDASAGRALPQLRAPEIELPEALTLHAGQRFEIRWSTPDDGVEELEILLSIDGGRHFPLRVSPELDAREGRYVWRVPSLSSADARLRLRYNRDGREMDGEITSAFTLIAASEAARGESGAIPGTAQDEELEDAAAPAAARVPVHEGTWWAGVGALDLPGARDRLAPPENRLTALADPPAAASASAASVCVRRETRTSVRPAPPASHAIPASSLTPARHFPLRN